jgi:hypothetical protein
MNVNAWSTVISEDNDVRLRGTTTRSRRSGSAWSGTNTDGIRHMLLHEVGRRAGDEARWTSGHRRVLDQHDLLNGRVSSPKIVRTMRLAAP